MITRCREHLGVNKAGLKIKGSPSAIGDHINQSGHAVSLKDFSILNRANNEFDLLIHESLLIDDCAKDGGEEFFTEMQCVLLSNSYRIVKDLRFERDASR